MAQPLDRYSQGINLKETRKDLSDRINALDEAQTGSALFVRYFPGNRSNSATVGVQHSPHWLALPPAELVPVSQIALRDFHLAERRCYIHKKGDTSAPIEGLRCPGRASTTGQSCQSARFTRKERFEKFVTDLDGPFLLVYFRLQCLSCRSK